MNQTTTLRRKLADRQTHVVTFTKQDGSLRQMRLRYEGGPITGSMMQVRDLDKDAIRTVNLATVHTHWQVTLKPQAEAARKAEAARTCGLIAREFSY